MKEALFAGIMLMFAFSLCGANNGEIMLCKPELSAGKPLMQCIVQRRSLRNFSARQLPEQLVSDILFVADGITRANGRKTVPTARNKQNQRVYAFTADGVYLYNNKKHSLVPVLKGDYRKNCGTQPFHGKAPLILLFVSDMKAVGNTPELQSLYVGNHSGSASQNVYLYAASADLATVVCGMLDRDKLKSLLKLPADHQVIFSQPIGYPGK